MNTYDNNCSSVCTTITKSYNVVVSDNILTSAWTTSTIDLRGGVYGVVENVTAQGNILVGGTVENPIQTDSHTTTANIANNLH